MSRREWIICERSGRWAAALRTALSRQAISDDRFTLREVRSLSELNAKIGARPYQLVLIEVTADGLEPVLTWLAEEATANRDARAVALLSDDIVLSACGDADLNRRDNEIEELLFGAGALEIARSPRRLQHILLLGRQCAARHERRAESLAPRESLADWAWAQLPWQEA